MPGSLNDSITAVCSGYGHSSAGTARISTWWQPAFDAAFDPPAGAARRGHRHAEAGRPPASMLPRAVRARLKPRHGGRREAAAQRAPSRPRGITAWYLQLRVRLPAGPIPAATQTRTRSGGARHTHHAVHQPQARGARGELRAGIPGSGTGSGGG